MKHEFALYTEEVIVQENHVFIDNPMLMHRIGTILRLQEKQPFILFDTKNYYELELDQNKKKYISAYIKHVHPIEPIKPSITIALPVLKQDNLEQALYSAVELGATEIQLLSTQKSHSLKATSKKRIAALMQAAAELSKNFYIPIVHEPCSLESFLAQSNKQQTLIFFDPEGLPLQDCFKALPIQSSKGYTLLIGPEGDLTTEEKTTVQQAGALFCALTPTVLRSFQALTVGLGVMRSWLALR